MTTASELHKEVWERPQRGLRCQMCRQKPATVHLRVEFPGVTDDVKVCAGCLKVRIITLVTQETESWIRIIWVGKNLVEVPTGNGIIEVSNNER